ncbi:MAG: hypothetical protein WBA13_18195 [Microcoleaceae cyanobacterium]
MFTFTKTQDSYANLTPKYDGNKTVFNFKGIKISEDENIFNLFTYVTEANDIQSWDDANKKFVEVPAFEPQICKVKFPKKTYTAYNKEFSPSKQDLFAIKQIKHLLKEDQEGKFTGRLDLSSQTDIERWESETDESLKQIRLKDIFRYETISSVSELSSFSVPATSSSSYGNRSGGGRYNQTAKQKLDERYSFVQEKMGELLFKNDAKDLTDSIHEMIVQDILRGKTPSNDEERQAVYSAYISCYYNLLLKILENE